MAESANRLCRGLEPCLLENAFVSIRPISSCMSVAVLAIAISPLAGPAQAAAPVAKNVLETYADIAEAGYSDSLAAAKKLKAAVDAFIAKPTEENLKAARGAWI